MATQQELLAKFHAERAEPDARAKRHTRHRENLKIFGERAHELSDIDAVRRASAQRIVRRGPERRSTNAAKRHASGTRRRAASSSGGAGSGDDGPLPPPALAAGRGQDPHVDAPPTKQELAYEVYRRELADGRRRTVDVYAAALCADVSISTMKRARTDLDVVKHRVGFGRGGWLEIEMPPAGRWYFDKWIGSRHIEVWSNWGETESEAHARYCAEVRAYTREAGLPTIEDVGRDRRSLAGVR
jgi:hypothetical protein